MKTLILNGSPKGEKGNTHIFATQFNKGMKTPCDIRCIAKENALTLARTAAGYDTLIFILPLYVHAMPGIVMRLLEQLQPLTEPTKSIGFIIQSGFTEPAQSRYAKRSFELLSRRLNYHYLGTVIKGGAAGVYLMSEGMNKDLFTELQKLGNYYEQTGSFDKIVAEKFEKNYFMSKRQARLNQVLNKIGIGNLFWNSMLRKHHAYKERKARPFISE